MSRHLTHQMDPLAVNCHFQVDVGFAQNANFGYPSARDPQICKFWTKLS